MSCNNAKYVVTIYGDIGLIEGSLYIGANEHAYILNIDGKKRLIDQNSILREIKLSKTIINLEEII